VDSLPGGPITLEPPDKVLIFGKPLDLGLVAAGRFAKILNDVRVLTRKVELFGRVGLQIEQ